MKVALVYDRVNKWGGAERVLLALHELFPSAPLYTSVYDQNNASWARVFPEIVPSYLQKVSLLRTRHEWIPFLMPSAFESFDFSNYDQVISVTSEAAKGIITTAGTNHLCYCLTPTRYLWSGYGQYFSSRFLSLLAKPAVIYMKHWDTIASQRPDNLVAISSTVQKRIKRYYNRESKLIHPPVEVDTFLNKKLKRKNFFLIVSRLVPYKKVDLAVKTFNKLGLPLVVVGTGSELSKLKSIAKSNIKFVGHVTDIELQSLYSTCKALIFPQNEDFGIVAVEAHSCGTPVIAYFRGGARDIVISGKTGVLFNKQTPDSLSNALDKFVTMKFDDDIISEHAQKFSKKRFQEEFIKIINI